MLAGATRDITRGAARTIDDWKRNDAPHRGRSWRTRAARRVLRTGLLAVLLAAGFAGAALAQTATYSATETIPVPPASDYAGSGGGDGWGIALSSTQVFNVFHHQTSLTVACHLQSDASPCWGPDTITDPNDVSDQGFSTSGQPGMYLDQSTGKLYVYATRNSDRTGGVVCVDTTQGGNTPDPFCGFTALTGIGEAPLNGGGFSGLSAPMLVGNHWYSFNYVAGVTVNAAGANATGAEDELLCFDVSTDAACSGQPHSMNIGSGQVDDRSPSPAGAAIGSQLIVPVAINGSDELACFDDGSQGSCSGSWPASAPSGYAGNNGAPFPLLDASGDLTGFCLPTGTDQCYGPDGSSQPTPAGMTAAIGSGSVSWNGPGLVLGPRVYVPAWSNTVYCYDASTQASCSGFPKQFDNLDLLYTVNPDPQRPTCIWVNSDNGSAQIQSFDAYTGGACGQGAIRVLASQFIVPRKACYPTSYQSLQVLSPSRSGYSDGSVRFDDNDGNQIAGIPDQPLDGTGSVNLNGLNLNSSTGLPQFLITLNGTSGTPGQVVVKLTWTGTDDPSCVGSSAQNVQVSSSGPGTSSSPPPGLRTLTVSLTGAGSGTVTDQNKSISCRPTCSHRFTSGAVVTLSAHPAAGSRFAGWRGAGCSGTGSCRVVMNDAKSVTAQFNRLPRETSKLRIGGAPEHGQGAGAVTGISAAPEQPGCTSELAFLADVGCSSTRLTVSGSIAQRASGHVLVTVYAWFGKRHGVGKISHGHWVVHLSVPGINQDPLAPKYLVVAHYAGNRAVKPGSVHRRVRIEVERPDLGGD